MTLRSTMAGFFLFCCAFCTAAPAFAQTPPNRTDLRAYKGLLSSTIREELGTLDRVRRLVRVYGVVNASPDFVLHTQVINGASDLFVSVFGDAGQHVRLAVGVSSLPFNLALEIELTAEITD